MPNVKIIFFGTSEFGAIVLEKLVQANMNPVLVVTTPDMPAGRNLKLTPPPAKILAEKYNLSVFQPKILANSKSEILNSKPNLFVVASYGELLPKVILDIPPKGTLNVHPSLLPTYRGPSPVHTAILNGDRETGVTIMLLDEKMDHGPILAQQEFSISNFQLSKPTFPELRDKLAELGAELLIKTIPQWIEGKAKSVPQDDSKATYTKIFTKEHGKIDWSKSADEIERQIRAFTPWPGTWTFWDKRLLKVLKARVITIPGEYQHTKPGTAFSFESQFAIITRKQALLVEEVQLEGKKPMSSKEFLLGHTDIIDSKLGPA